MKKNKTHHNHLNLLCDIGDLTNLLTGSYTIDNFLNQASTMVADYLDAHVCSIYLYEEMSNELVLAATTGLNPDAIGKVRMKLGEGLVGYCLEQLTPVCEARADHNPHFKYFEEAHEERFQSFLVVPIHRGQIKIGSLVVQHETPDYFDDSDIMALRAVSSQLASSVENARLLMEIHHEHATLPSRKVTSLPGLIKVHIGVNGYAYAPATVFRKNRRALLHDTVRQDEHYTMADFRRAIEVTAQQLQSLQTKFATRLPESASLIFTTHFMMLKDPSFVGEMTGLIENGTPPQVAVSNVSLRYITLFSSSAHGYIREKANDVEDLALRILRNLKTPDHKEDSFSEKAIVIAGQLYPSDILRLVSHDIQGIILVGGGITAHISILSRSLHIPLVMSDQAGLLALPEETPVLIDAHVGNIYINPSSRIVQQFDTLNSVDLADNTMHPVTRTSDGQRIRLMANINLLSEAPLARKLKAEGVGLYRTEFPFLIRTTLPSETEQYVVYRRLLDEMTGRDVIFRTLDVGGEKVLSYLDADPDPNPELGLRSIRFTLKHRDVFETQLRAILRAAAGLPEVRIMFPMISSLDQFLQARQVVFDSMESLARDNLVFNAHPVIGMMVELPSILDIIDDLSDAADFFSIGTNDFIQYMLAVDRTNRSVSEYYCAHHPSVLRGLSRVAAAVLKKGKDISVCGEMAHEEAYIPFLLGIGIRQLSVDPQFLPLIQQGIARISMSEAVVYAQQLLNQATLKGVEAVLSEKRWQKPFDKEV